WIDKPDRQADLARPIHGCRAERRIDIHATATLRYRALRAERLRYVVRRRRATSAIAPHHAAFALGDATAFLRPERVERRVRLPAGAGATDRLADLLHRRARRLRRELAAGAAAARHRLVHDEVLARQHADLGRAERGVGIFGRDVALRAFGTGPASLV